MYDKRTLAALNFGELRDKLQKLKQFTEAKKIETRQKASKLRDQLPPKEENMTAYELEVCDLLCESYKSMKYLDETLTELLEIQ